MAGSLTTSNDSEDRSSVTLEGARPAEVALSDPGDAVDPCSLVIESRSGIVGELGQVEFAGAAEGLGHCTDVGTQTEAKGQSSRSGEFPSLMQQNPTFPLYQS